MASRSIVELWHRPFFFTRISRQQCITGKTQTLTGRTAQCGISNTFNSASQLPIEEQEGYDDDFPKSRSPTPSQRPSQPTLYSRRLPTSPEVSRNLETLFHGMPATYAPPLNAPTITSSDEMRAASSTRVWGGEFGLKTGMRPRIVGLDADTMDFSGIIIKEPQESILKKQQEDAFSSYPRLNPTYGRTVELDLRKGRDIVRGINMLGSLMARNKVRSDVFRQRFHERPGLKRKRLKSERWRARFKQAFSDITGRVSELTKKGW